ncbi:MAG: histidine kinase dimerization/phosphoacceptor domain-containing protein [Chthoniobacterales bacterium]
MDRPSNISVPKEWNLPQNSASDDALSERVFLAKRLHDGICQHLTGTILVAKTLSNHLEARMAPEAEQAREVVTLLSDASKEIRDLMRDLGGG